MPISRENSKQGQELFSCVWHLTRLFHIHMAKKTTALGAIRCWTQPRKTEDCFPSRGWLRGHCKAGLGIQLSFVFFCPWASNRWLKSQSCILITIAVIWTGREKAELPPLSEPCLCWMSPLCDPQHTNLAFCLFCKTARLSPSRLSILQFFQLRFLHSWALF